MDQAELREWERKCIQEEVPRCTAACPLHVDVKQFCALMAQRRFDKAWQILAKTLPLPGVLARICDGPCKEACVRTEVGGAIQVESLERACAELGAPVSPPKPLPSKHKKVAVFGGGLTGLSAAWELARRGYDVTLICSVLGESLPELPDDVLERELSSLERLGVRVESGLSVSRENIESQLETVDAAFVDSGVLPVQDFGYGSSDRLTLGTERAGLFASIPGEVSPVLQAAAGRRAANSIERYTQGVSMVSNRDREGAYETRLYTSLKGVESVAPVISAGDSYSEVEARDEAKRCLQCECMECVKVCEYMRHYQHYPKVYARRIYNNESIVMGTRQANTMINSCMLCGLCETVCPEDFSMADLCLEARRSMVRRNKMPPSAHEFALRDMAFADGGKAALVKHAPGTDHSDYLFFPGCQLPASDPEAVEAAYADLRAKLGSVGLFLRCCGAPAEWSGRESLTAESLDALKSAWETMGKPIMIVACPTCLKTLRAGLPDAEITSHWSLLRNLGLPDGARGSSTRLAINDPCSARHNAMLREDIRALLEKCGVESVEPELSGELTQCCGFGGLLSEANPDLARAVTEKRAAVAQEDFVTYCVMCRDRIAGTGKRALHLYDLLYPREDDPASRPAPGYSERRENRARLKSRLLRDVWNDGDSGESESFEEISVEFTDEVTALMEERRILKSDVQKVLLNARETGKQFKHEETGRLLVSYRPVVVTYWVEFEPTNGGYLVHNVWSHRMQVKGVQS
ncbi:putative Fe-S oxidoreductase [Pseudodesulfovibrio profundus]|uniref:Putative Fe-S oxidoreductase n=1 Tax=Pseudodesulfovibrio profundus TaxID=57320 RepID=A0A2C8F6F8_9BACT|nr:pyridine nucleotide-disulfide oxidoreductase/dicluster-binding protein [Pseudodesulfovibrio profundus]SOB58010.1 putative Fe-S oxidoreductase [Pseudodesulfovibrio profundus]